MLMYCTGKRSIRTWAGRTAEPEPGQGEEGEGPEEEMGAAPPDARRKEEAQGPRHRV